MQIFVSLSKGVHVDKQALTKAVGFRVLDHRLLKEQDGFAFYAFVCFANDDSGDYDLKIAKLRQQGLMTNSYKLSNITTVSDGYQSVFEASKAMDQLSPDGKYMSLSSPPPLQSSVFQLNDFHIQITPGLQAIVDSWARVQDVAPLRYAVVNPRTQAIEVAYKDASAHNSVMIERLMRDSLYAALGDYSAGKSFDAPNRALV